MNKKKLLTIILAIQSVVLVAAVVAALLLWPGLTGGKGFEPANTTEVNGTEGDKYNGFADVTLYGAKADDGKDDTAAFIKAAETGAGVYVPLGTFNIKKTVSLNGQHLKGAGIDGTVILFEKEGTMVKMQGAAIVEDITLSFAEGVVTGNETEGQQVALQDEGITAGAMLRSVKLSNVGTGYYSPGEKVQHHSFSVEAVVIDKFSFKAMQIKDAEATVIRTVTVGQALKAVDSALAVGGTFTAEAITFSGTKCAHPLELKDCPSAIINSVIFSGVEATSGSLVKSTNTSFSMKTVTAKGTKADTLVNAEESVGNVIMLWSDSGLKVDADGKIGCDRNISN